MADTKQATPKPHKIDTADVIAYNADKVAQLEGMKGDPKLHYTDAERAKMQKEIDESRQTVRELTEANPAAAKKAIAEDAKWGAVDHSNEIKVIQDALEVSGVQTQAQRQKETVGIIAGYSEYVNQTDEVKQKLRELVQANPEAAREALNDKGWGNVDVIKEAMKEAGVQGGTTPDHVRAGTAKAPVTHKNEIS